MSWKIRGLCRGLAARPCGELQRRWMSLDLFFHLYHSVKHPPTQGADIFEDQMTFIF